MKFQKVSLPNIAPAAGGYPGYCLATFTLLNQLADSMRISKISLSAIGPNTGDPVGDALKVKGLTDQVVDAANVFDFTALAWNNQPIHVIAFGDSLTYGADSSDPVTKSYPAQLQTALGTNASVLKKGVTGRTTRQMLIDAPTDVYANLSLTSYARNLVLDLSGINDINNTTDVITLQQTKDNKTALVLGAVSRGADYVLATLLPCLRADIQADRENINNWLRANYRALGALALVDLASNAYFNPNDPAKSPDGLHWTDAGYFEVAKMFYYALLPFFAKFSVPVNGTGFPIVPPAPAPSASPANYIAAMQALNPYYYNRLLSPAGSTSLAPTVGTGNITIPANSVGGGLNYWGEKTPLFGAANKGALAGVNLAALLTPGQEVAFIFATKKAGDGSVLIYTNNNGGWPTSLGSIVLSIGSDFTYSSSFSNNTTAANRDKVWAGQPYQAFHQWCFVMTTNGASRCMLDGKELVLDQAHSTNSNGTATNGFTNGLFDIMDGTAGTLFDLAIFVNNTPTVTQVQSLYASR